MAKEKKDSEERLSALERDLAELRRTVGFILKTLQSNGTPVYFK